jgi:uncharacterized protein YbjT (DUF2867 family)
MSAAGIVLVIGGTRATGKLVVESLLRRGRTVRVLARAPARAREALGPRVEIVPGDLTKPGTLPPAFVDVTDVVFTAGVRSGRPARRALVKATEYDGILHTLAAAKAVSLPGRFVYMNAISGPGWSIAALGLNLWKGNTLAWRARAEDAIRASGLDYVIVRAAVLRNRPAGERAIQVTKNDRPLSFLEFISRADVAEAIVEALDHPSTARATFEVAWDSGERIKSWTELLRTVKADT